MDEMTTQDEMVMLLYAVRRDIGRVIDMADKHPEIFDKASKAVQEKEMADDRLN